MLAYSEALCQHCARTLAMQIATLKWLIVPWGVRAVPDESLNMCFLAAVMTPASVKPNARPHTSKNPVHLYDDAISLLNLRLHIRMKGLHNPLFVPLSSSNHPPAGYFGNGRLHAPRYPSCNFCTSSDADCECNIGDCVTSDSSGVTGPFETYNASTKQILCSAGQRL